MPPELEKQFDEKFPQTEGALTFSGKRAKAFLSETYSLGIREGLRRAKNCIENEPFQTTIEDKQLKEAAELGWSRAQFHIGVALSRKEEEITKKV